jgi:hypothetical protein
MLTLLIVVVVFAVAFWAVVSVLAACGVGEPAVTIVRVVFVVLFLLWLLGALGVGTGLPSLRLR